MDGGLIRKNVQFLQNKVEREYKDKIRQLPQEKAVGLYRMLLNSCYGITI